MVNGMFKKGLVVGIIILFISVSVAPSINANIGRSPVMSKFVETSVRIHRDNGITSYTLRLTENELEEVDRIFDNLKVRFDSAESDEEIDEIYDDAVESLYELGLFPKDMTVEEAKQFIKGKSRKSSVKIPVGNLETVNENWNCQIAGRTTDTVMFDLDNPVLNSILQLRRLFMYYTFWQYSFRFYGGKIGNISLGSSSFSSYDLDYYPAKGWVWTNGSNGVVSWIGKFYGRIEDKVIWWDTHQQWGIYAYTGIRNFEGLWIKRIFGQANLLGNAERVRLSYDEPPPHWP
jgi:hypothetical protein